MKFFQFYPHAIVCPGSPKARTITSSRLLPAKRSTWIQKPALTSPREIPPVRKEQHSDVHGRQAQLVGGMASISSDGEHSMHAPEAHLRAPHTPRPYPFVTSFIIVVPEINFDRESILLQISESVNNSPTIKISTCVCFKYLRGASSKIYNRSNSTEHQLCVCWILEKFAGIRNFQSPDNKSTCRCQAECLCKTHWRKWASASKQILYQSELSS
jgi:hypothetical protein